MALKDFPGLPQLDHISPLSTDANIKKMVNVEDPEEFNDTANKGYVDDQIAGVTSLWEIDGTETQLKTADEIDMQTKKIINLVDPTSDQEAATKKYVDDNIGGTATTVNINQAAFTPEDPTITWSKTEQWLINNDGGNEKFAASIQLPNGSTISSVEGEGDTSSDVFTLYKVENDGTATSVAFGNINTPETGLSEVVDNTTYSYQAAVRLGNGKKLYNFKVILT